MRDGGFWAPQAKDARVGLPEHGNQGYEESEICRRSLDRGGGGGVEEESTEECC